MSTESPELLPSLPQSPTTGSIAASAPAPANAVAVPIAPAPANLPAGVTELVVSTPGKQWYQSKTIVLNVTIAVLTALLAALQAFIEHDYSFTVPAITICIINFLNVLIRFATSRPITN